MREKQHITEVNRARRIAKDKAAKERARRKRDQRVRATLNPKREAWTVAMVQQVFGDTHARLCGWLADYENILAKEYAPEYGHHTFTHMIRRRPFVTRNGYEISIQQGASHHCSADSVEMWNCPHHEMLAPYGEGWDPYAYVPLHVVAAYIDWLEEKV